MIFSNLQIKNNLAFKIFLVILFCLSIFSFNVSSVMGQAYRDNYTDQEIAELSVSERFDIYNEMELQILRVENEMENLEVGETLDPADERAYGNASNLRKKLLSIPFGEGQIDTRTAEENIFYHNALLAQTNDLEEFESNEEALDRLGETRERASDRIDEEVERIKNRETSYLSCGGWDSLKLDCWLANLSYHAFFVPSSAVLVASGRLFDYSMERTVVKMNQTLFPNEGGENAIDISWGIIRDYVNILFIFVLLYISIKTIFKGTSGTGREIARVVIVALLINFSLLFTKAFIDLGNILSISIYDDVKNNTSIQIDGQEYGCKVSSLVSGLLDKPNTGWNDGSISCAVIARTGVASTVDTPDDDTVDFIKVIIQSIGGSVLMLIIAMILFVVSFMLLTRIIILAFVLFSSAAAFGGYMFPQLKSMISKPWEKALIGQTFFPFVLLLMLNISLSLMEEMTDFVGNGWSNLSAGALPNVIFNYVIIVALLIMSINVARKISTYSGSVAGKITNTTLSKTIGGVGRIGRFGIGGSARFVANRTSDTKLGRRIRSGADFVSKRSFDLRNMPGMKYADKIDSDLSKGGKGKGGFDKFAADREQKINERESKREKRDSSLNVYEQREKEVLDDITRQRENDIANTKKQLDLKSKELDKEKADLAKMRSSGNSNGDEINKQREVVDNLNSAVTGLSGSINKINNKEIKIKSGFMGQGKKTFKHTNEAIRRKAELDDEPKVRARKNAEGIDPVSEGKIKSVLRNTARSKWARKRRAELGKEVSDDDRRNQQLIEAIKESMNKDQTGGDKE